MTCLHLCGVSLQMHLAASINTISSHLQYGGRQYPCSALHALQLVIVLLAQGSCTGSLLAQSHVVTAAGPSVVATGNAGSKTLTGCAGVITDATAGGGGRAQRASREERATAAEVLSGGQQDTAGPGGQARPEMLYPAGDLDQIKLFGVVRPPHDCTMWITVAARQQGTRNASAMEGQHNWPLFCSSNVRRALVSRVNPPSLCMSRRRSGAVDHPAG